MLMFQWLVALLYDNDDDMILKWQFTYFCYFRVTANTSGRLSYMLEQTFLFGALEMGVYW